MNPELFMSLLYLQVYTPVLAAKIGDYEKAYEMYLRSARLDLDNYNKDSEDGCHITSMSCTWLAVVHGFGGFRVKEGIPVFSPCLPENGVPIVLK